MVEVQYFDKEDREIKTVTLTDAEALFIDKWERIEAAIRSWT